MAEDERHLMIMRHARAESAAAEDRLRQLTARGRQDATEAGEWAASSGFLPDHVLVSSAARAVATWECFATGAGVSLRPQLSDELYAAGPESALEVLRSAPKEARTLMYLGHNPTVAYLVHLLDDGGADPEAFRGISEGYPTSALTVLSVPGPWAALDTGGARIVDFHVGHA